MPRNDDAATDLAALRAAASQEQDPLAQYMDKTGVNKEFYERVTATVN